MKESEQRHVTLRINASGTAKFLLAITFSSNLFFVFMDFLDLVSLPQLGK